MIRLISLVFMFVFVNYVESVPNRISLGKHYNDISGLYKKDEIHISLKQVCGNTYEIKTFDAGPEMYNFWSGYAFFDGAKLTIHYLDFEGFKHVGVYKLIGKSFVGQTCNLCTNIMEYDKFCLCD